MNKWLYKILDFIEENLTRKITVDVLVEESGLSSRHFQRLFKQKTGDSIGEYVRGRRLSAALLSIMSSPVEILDIALEYQFESQQAFTRAFKSRFGMPPRRFKLDKVNNPPSLKIKPTPEYIQLIENEQISLEPKILDLDAGYYLGLSTKIDMVEYANTDSMLKAVKLSQDFARAESGINNYSEKARQPGQLTISHRVPLSERKQGDGLFLLAGKQVKKNTPVLPEMHLLEAGASKYALFKFKGNLEQYWLAAAYIAASWLPRSPYWIGNAPVFQYSLKTDSEASSYCIAWYIPLRPRKAKLVCDWW